MKRQVNIPIWGKRPIQSGELTEALASVADADRCLLEWTKSSAYGSGYRVFRFATRKEAKEALERERRRNEPWTWRLSLATPDATVEP